MREWGERVERRNEGERGSANERQRDGWRVTLADELRYYEPITC